MSLAAGAAGGPGIDWKTSTRHGFWVQESREQQNHRGLSRNVGSCGLGHGAPVKGSRGDLLCLSFPFCHGGWGSLSPRAVVGTKGRPERKPRHILSFNGWSRQTSLPGVGGSGPCSRLCPQFLLPPKGALARPWPGDLWGREGAQRFPPLVAPSRSPPDSALAAPSPPPPSPPFPCAAGREGLPIVLSLGPKLKLMTS